MQFEEINKQEKLKALNTSNSKSKININIINDYNGEKKSHRDEDALLSDTENSNSIQEDSDRKDRSNSKQKLNSNRSMEDLME